MGSQKRPAIGLHVRITDHFAASGVRQPYDIVFEGIVAPEASQPRNPQMVALKPVDADGPISTVWHNTPPQADPVADRTVEVIGWPIGMIALWSGYMPNYLKDAFVNVPMRWDGEFWLSIAPPFDAPPHNGESYGEGPDTVTLTMGPAVWDGVIPR